MNSSEDPFEPAAFPGKELWDQEGRRRLAKLLSIPKQLNFADHPKPVLSIILVLHNKAHLTLLCLEAIRTSGYPGYELIIVDNGSADQTPALLERCTCAHIIRNTTNGGFGEACMQAADSARGQYLLFLNNDAILQAGAIQKAVSNFSDQEVGAVGGKILLADGRLQEAGSIVWKDGSAHGYGRGEDPARPEFNFRRPVDYCSGAFLFIPRELFRRLEGFDARYLPAYYEDTDYCMKVWTAGFKVVYDPEPTVYHYESASSGDNERARALMAERQGIFFERWGRELSQHCEPDAANIVRARIASQFKKKRILYVDDRVPHRSLGSGFPRSNDVIRELVDLGHQVSCVPFDSALDALSLEYRDIPRDVELVGIPNAERKRLLSYVAQADLIWISRPHNMSAFLDLLVEYGDTQARLIYDAEAIFAHRERLGVAFTGREVPERVLDSRLRREVALASAADAIAVVSPADQQWFQEEGIRDAHLLGHRMLPRPTSSLRKGRDRVLFVGAIHRKASPNADSMFYFCQEIWPLVRARTHAILTIAGAGTDEVLGDLRADGIEVLGSVYDLAPLYEKAAMVVIPTRFAAGLPFKAHEAAAYGVPMVVSSLIGRQLQWEHGRDLLIGNDSGDFATCCCRLFDDDELWQKLRTNSLTRIICDFGPAAFTKQISSLLNEVGHCSTSG